MFSGGSIERFGKFHRGSVLKIQCEDNHLISTGEDGVMAIVDVRQMKILQKVRQTNVLQKLF